MGSTIPETLSVSGPHHDSGRLAGAVAVVTGASGGIGRAIAIALANEGARLCLLGRNEIRLAETAAAVQPFSRAVYFHMDLTLNETFEPLLHYLETEAGKLDILIHCAGVAHNGPLESSRMDDLDLQFAVNVRGPYNLTRTLLPLLMAARGQVVFMNSSLGLVVQRPDIGQYAATKHALKAIADSLRQEVNPKGIRVLSVFAGRTATPMQEAICQSEGMPFRPEILLQPEDIASVVVHTLSLPLTAEVTDISIRPMSKG